MTGDVVRWTRALTLASVILVSGLAGHVSAAGSAPDRSLLLPVFVLTAAALAPFVRRPLSNTRTVLLLLAGQGVLHVVLQMLGGSAHHSGATGTAQLMHASAPEAAFRLGVPTGAHLGMLLAHVAAAGVAKQKLPERLFVMDAFPRTASGKVRKDLLRTEVRRTVEGAPAHAA